MASIGLSYAYKLLSMRDYFKNELYSKIEKKCGRIEAEKAVLGAILIDTDKFKAINTVKDILTPSDFYRQANQEIYSAMLEMFEDKKGIDLRTTIAVLENKHILEKVGGVSYVTDLANYVPSAANVKYYADIVKENALRRILQSKINKAMYYCDIENIYDGIYKAQNELLEIILEYFKEAREKREMLIQNPEYVNSILREGAIKARKIAQEKITLAKKVVGLLGNSYKYL